MSTDVEFSLHGPIGRITLNRPKARNALTTEMVRAVTDQLDAWEIDPQICAVLLIGAGDHGLCAGGDVRDMQASAIRGDDGAAEFFRSEYRMNARIHQFTKPYIAIMDGLVMGGGIGISTHGSLRIVTERSLLAMPEVTIGICPDVGSTWILSRAPGELGTYLGLTGATFTASDAIVCGFADCYMPEANIADFVHRLESEPLGQLLGELCVISPASPLMSARSWIDECFAFDSVGEILSALDSHASGEANSTAELIRTKSPSAVAVTLEALRRARNCASLEQALEVEFGVSCYLMYQHDAIEGIRALIVDKDRNPQWQPESAAGVTHDFVDAAFAPSPFGTLGLAN